MVLILILVLVLRCTFLVYYTLGKHIVILCLLVGGIEAQRLSKGVQCCLVLLLRKEALTEVAVCLCTLLLGKELIARNSLVEGVRLFVGHLLILGRVGLLMVVGIRTVVENFILCRVAQIGLLILLQAIAEVARLELLVTLAHQLALGEVLSNGTLGQCDTEKHKAKSHKYVIELSH